MRLKPFEPCPTEDFIVSPIKTDLASLAPSEMERAYLEYRRACYGFLYRAAADRGALEHLRKPTTLEEFAERIGVVALKKPVAGRLLDALVRYGGVRRTAGRPPRYVAVAPNELPTTCDTNLVQLATGKQSFEELGYSDNYARIIDALTTDDNPISAGFDEANLALWDEAMQLPFYRHSRLQAVNTIVPAGSRMLDLACGTGLGLRELAERMPASDDTVVFGVDVSIDFVLAATRRVADDPRVQVVRGNLEHPLPFLRDSFFDGAMLVGAYHFLKDPAPMWDTVARVLRPGGTFCAALVFSEVDSYDWELLALRYALRRPQA